MSTDGKPCTATSGSFCPKWADRVPREGNTDGIVMAHPDPPGDAARNSLTSLVISEEHPQPPRDLGLFSHQGEEHSGMDQPPSGASQSMLY